MADSKSTNLKGKAKKLESFFSKLVDSFENDKPPKPPPKANQLDAAFNSLSISTTQTPLPSSNSSFVGGFNPGYSVNPGPYVPNHASMASSAVPLHFSSSAPNLPKPIQMAMPSPFSDYPQSLTMQMALLPPVDSRFARARPHSNPTFPSATKPSFSASTPARPSYGTPASIATPTKSAKSELSSAPSTPGSRKAGQEQCSGVTKAGKRCTRMVKTTAFDFNDNDPSSIPRFCHQHSKELLGPSGYYARKTGEWVKFDDWIPSYLQQETQVSLRVEMEKARSQSDVPGYIYTFEIRETQTETIKLKVGRAVNIVRRIDQWGKQCGSKEQVLRGFFPGTVEPDEDGNDGSLMKGRLKAGEKGAWCHRLERLIHLELADLACSAPYLDPSWPKLDRPPESKANGSQDSNRSVPCPDCSNIHKEIFEFQRWKKGKNKGKEWEHLVKPVVERWGRFVELHV